MIQRQLLLPEPPNKPLLHPIVATSFSSLYYILCKKEKRVRKEERSFRFCTGRGHGRIHQEKWNKFNKNIDLILKRCIIIRKEIKGIFNITKAMKQRS